MYIMYYVGVYTRARFIGSSQYCTLVIDEV